MGPLSRENLFTELDKMLKAPSMEEEGYTPASVKAFVQINRRLLSSSLEDNVLSTKLKILSHKISEEFTDQKGINLAHEIHNIAQSLILPTKGRDAPELPAEIWEKIAGHTMEDARITYDIFGVLHPNIESFSPLGAMKGIKTGIKPSAEYVEARIVDKHKLSLKTICKDADAAIAYAITNKLSFINLKDFPDLEMRHLDQLFAEAEHNIAGLVLKTDHPIEIKKWPEGLKAISLECKNLVSFPPLPNSLMSFSITGIASHPIQIQGPYPSLVSIFIFGDGYSLDGSPMPELKFASIVNSGKSVSLPNELPKLTHLTINTTEESLTPLPEIMPKLTSLTLVGQYARRLLTPALEKVVERNKGDCWIM